MYILGTFQKSTENLLIRFLAKSISPTKVPWISKHIRPSKFSRDGIFEALGFRCVGFTKRWKPTISVWWRRLWCFTQKNIAKLSNRDECFLSWHWWNMKRWVIIFMWVHRKKLLSVACDFSHDHGKMVPTSYRYKQACWIGRHFYFS